MDAFKMNREKVKRELHKNATSYTEKKSWKQHLSQQLQNGHVYPIFKIKKGEQNMLDTTGEVKTKS